MKWFRHDCDAHVNVDLIAVGLRFGAEGLGWWWILVELAAGDYDADREASGVVANIQSNTGKLDLTVLSHVLFAAGKEDQVKSFLDFLAERKLIDAAAWTAESAVQIPRISMYADDTQRLKARQRKDSTDLDGARRSSTTLDSETDIDTERDQRKKINAAFESLWKKYPSKKGRIAAERHFHASVKTDKDIADISTALGNYLASDNVGRGYVFNGSTWFLNWRDWITNPITKPTQDGMSPEVRAWADAGKGARHGAQ